MMHCSVTFVLGEEGCRR